MEIKIRDLKKCYGKKVVLDNLSFTVGNGMTGLLGRNGAGKTTLLKILAALEAPTSGTVMYGQIPLEKIRQIRPMLGYLPQEFSLYPDMSAEEILRYLAALSELPAELQRRRIPELLQRVHLWEDRKKKVWKLSGGMKRRLGIAQALLNDPEILLADEPTAGLDPQERLRFYALLSEFSADRTVIVSSHIVSDIETVCKNVVVLDAGKLLFQGATEALAGMAEEKVCERTLPKERAAGNPALRKVTVEDGYMELLRKPDGEGKRNASF